MEAVQFGEIETRLRKEINAERYKQVLNSFTLEVIIIGNKIFDASKVRGTLE